MRVSEMTIRTERLATVAEAEDKIEALRQILVKEQYREVAYDEAIEIGEELIEFFEVLGGFNK